MYRKLFGATAVALLICVVVGWRSAQEANSRRVVGGAFEKRAAPRGPQALHFSCQPSAFSRGEDS